PGLRHGRADDRGDGAGARPDGAQRPGQCDQAVKCFSAQPCRSVVGEQCPVRGRARIMVVCALLFGVHVAAIVVGQPVYVVGECPAALRSACRRSVCQTLNDCSPAMSPAPSPSMRPLISRMSSLPAIGSTAAVSTARRSATKGSLSSPEEPCTWTANPAASRAAATAAKCARLRHSTAFVAPSGMVANHSVRALRPLVRKSGSCAPELISMPTCPSPAPSRAVSGLSLLSVSPSAMRLATCRIDRSLRQLVLSVSDLTSVNSYENRLILSALAPRYP